MCIGNVFHRGTTALGIIGTALGGLATVGGNLGNLAGMNTGGNGCYASEYKLNYIGRTLLALDTHINWSGISFEFKKEQHLDSTNQKSTLGDYNPRTKTIRIGGAAYQNTVAHEMGHALDSIWAEDVFGYSGNYPSETMFSPSKIADKETRQFYKNFRLFINSLNEKADLRSNYTQRNTETFARFVARFVQWADMQAGNRFYGEDGYYKDSFTASQYIEFARLLQEKAMLDAKKAAAETETEYHATRAERGRSIEMETMENNRFERLRNFGDNLPKQWYAFTRDYFYIYENHSFMDYTLLLTARIIKSNRADIDTFMEEIENGTFESAKTYDRWLENFRRGKGSNSWHRISTPKTGTAGQPDGVHGSKQRSNSVGYSENDRPNSEELTEYHTVRNNLSDREVLEMAAGEIKTDDLPEGEKEALRILQDKLAKLKDLQDKRIQEGQIYKEQQFGKNGVDREAAAKTRERMNVLDGQIAKAEAELLNVENTDIAKKVLQKARKVVEKAEREHQKDIFRTLAADKACVRL